MNTLARWVMSLFGFISAGKKLATYLAWNTITAVVIMALMAPENHDAVGPIALRVFELSISSVVALLDSMTLTTEVFIFDTSDAFRKDLGLPIPAFNTVLKADGAHGPVYYGKQLEDPSTGYVFLNWESYEAHKAMIEGPSYSGLIQSLTPSLGGKRSPEMYHVQFSAPTIAFEKPVTEVLILMLKAPENRETVESILSKISEATKKLLVYGRTREDETKYVVVGGWDTIEAHREAAARPEATAALEKLYSLVSKEHQSHVNLLQYGL